MLLPKLGCESVICFTIHIMKNYVAVAEVYKQGFWTDSVAMHDGRRRRKNPLSTSVSGRRVARSGS